MNSEQQKIQEFLKLLNESFDKDIRKSKRIALAFSGGIDSSLLAKMAKDKGIKFVAYVVGIRDCHDILAAKKVARELKIKLKIITLTKRNIKEALKPQTKILERVYKELKKNSKSTIPAPDPVSVSFNLPLFFVAKHAKEKIIMLGQGPDNLLGGYHKHKKLPEKEAIKEINKDTQEIVQISIPQYKAIGKYFNKNISTPYLSKELIKFCSNLPYKFKINKGIDKYILRIAARKAGLSKRTAERKKKAAQYGTKIMDEIIKIAKAEGKTDRQLIKEYRE